VSDRGLENRQARLAEDHAPDLVAVQLAIRLRARGPHGGALRRVQRTELNAGPVDSARHGAAERVDFLRQVALADAADRRVAAHLTERCDLLRDQKRVGTGARGSQRGFRSGVTAADHDDIEPLGHCSINNQSGPRILMQTAGFTRFCGPVRRYAG
jgi:hypothetical protein